MNEPRALSLKQERFIQAYLGSCKGNASAAALEAGYSVRQSAGDVLSNPVVRARIDEHLQALSLTSAEVLAELTEVARAEWKHFLQIKTDNDGNVIDAKLVLGDKVKALELLGKYHKLFVDKVEHGGDADFLGALREAGTAG